jgi:tRNA dimethylallyltransferase
MTNNLKTVIAIVGPTASGKTDLSINIAQKLNGEIISADSRLVYKDFNIGTAKPSLTEMATIPHHLIDVVSPDKIYTVGDYREKADSVITNLLNDNKVPIITGGTGFYVRTLLGDLEIPDVKPDIEFRESIEKQITEKGKEYLHQLLKEKDPITAEKLHPNDIFRITRALEVQHVLGKPMSEAQALSEPKYNVIYIGLNTQDREILYERINIRVDNMIQSGLVEEVKFLVNKYGKTLSLLKTLGYKEICEYLDSEKTLEESIEEIKKNTRNYAKRQLTWFRANKNISWFFIDSEPKEIILDKVIKKYYDRI